MNTTIARFLALLVLSATCGPAIADSLYWTDQNLDMVRSVNLDGTNDETLTTVPGAGPRGISLDLAGGKMYWTNTTAPINGLQGIQRANLDGSGVEDVFLTGPGTGPSGIALDSTNGKLYWTDQNLDMVRSVNLDGTGEATLVSIPGASPRGIALDLTAGKMYWTNATAPINGMQGIQRANLDGSGAEDVYLTGPGTGPSGIAILVPEPSCLILGFLGFSALGAIQQSRIRRRRSA